MSGDTEDIALEDAVRKLFRTVNHQTLRTAIASYPEVISLINH